MLRLGKLRIAPDPGSTFRCGALVRLPMSDRDRKISNSSSHLWPVVRLGLAAEIATLTAELLHTEWLSPEAVEAQQMEQFNRLLRFAVDHST